MLKEKTKENPTLRSPVKLPNEIVASVTDPRIQAMNALQRHEPAGGEVCPRMSSPVSTTCEP